MFNLLPTISYTIPRLRMVKNTNFFWDSKKLFLTYWKTVFWVTEHFCIKWTFWKNAFFCPKNAFFWQKWHLDPRCSALERRCQGSFFSGGILLLISWRILLGKVGHMVKPPAEHFQFSLKWAIFGRFENKSFWKWLELKTYCVCYPNTLLYMVLDYLWATKCHDFGQKL